MFKVVKVRKYKKIRLYQQHKNKHKRNHRITAFRWGKWTLNRLTMNLNIILPFFCSFGNLTWRKIKFGLTRAVFASFWSRLQWRRLLSNFEEKSKVGGIQQWNNAMSLIPGMSTVRAKGDTGLWSWERKYFSPQNGGYFFLYWWNRNILIWAIFANLHFQ